MAAVRRTENHVYADAIRMSDAELAAEMRSLLGAKLVAYIGGVKCTRSVSQWVDGVSIGGAHA